MKWFASLWCMVALTVPAAHAAGADDALVAPIQSRWAQIAYATPKGARATQYADLAQQAAALVDTHPRLAQPLVWQGIVLASEAGAEGGLGALSLVRQARAVLERAVDIDGTVLDGSAYTTLASLYAEVPGWPIGFGDKDRARADFAKALAINPGGIDDNYFYAKFLAAEGDRPGAIRHLEVALKAPARPGRALADQGRRAEAKALLSRLQG